MTAAAAAPKRRKTADRPIEPDQAQPAAEWADHARHQ